MKENKKPILGITIGDMNGIGPELILRVFSDSRMLDLCVPVIYGSVRVLDYYKKILHFQDISFNLIRNVSEIKKNKMNVLDCLSDELVVQEGESTLIAGKLAFSALENATNDIFEKQINAIVTAPINKSNVTSFYKGFSGHTGYFAERDQNTAIMILHSDIMKIAMVTGHIALTEIKKELTTEKIMKSLEAFNRSLKSDFGIDRPKIAVLALNPHAGEQGIMGNEELQVIIPAINQVKTKNILAFGPYPSDGFFGAQSYRNFDGILAMYHDQALIPFKTLCFENGVNFTAGLSFIRTSPDHGTAYDIAGKGIASEASMRMAIYAACDIFEQRKAEKIESEVLKS